MYLYSMFIDDENNIWASSNKGILKFHPEVLEFRQFTPVDGVQEYEYNAGSAWQSREGDIVMAGLNGINYFNPSKLNENVFPPKVLIQNINIGGIDLILICHLIMSIMKLNSKIIQYLLIIWLLVIGTLSKISISIKWKVMMING